MIVYGDVKSKHAERFAQNRNKFLQTLTQNKPDFDILEELIKDSKGKLKRKLKNEILQIESPMQLWNLIEILAIDTSEQRDITETLSLNI